MPSRRLHPCAVALFIAACTSRPGPVYHGDLAARADSARSASQAWVCDTTFMSLGLEVGPPYLKCGGKVRDSAVAVVSDTLGLVLSVVTEATVGEPHGLEIFRAWQAQFSREFGRPLALCNPGGFDSVSVWKGSTTHAILGLKIGNGLVHRVVSLGRPACRVIGASR
jgi:hypothetical protein